MSGPTARWVIWNYLWTFAGWTMIAIPIAASLGMRSWGYLLLVLGISVAVGTTMARWLVNYERKAP